MIYERIQFTYVTYYYERMKRNLPFSEAELIKILLDICELQLYLIKNKTVSHTFRLNDYVFTKGNEMKLFLIPTIKKPKTNKIVIKELAKLHDKVKYHVKKKNVKKRL